MGVNQTTVARRIESLEAALELKLFERGQSGSRLTEAGRDLVAEGETVERAATNFHNRARAHGRGLAGSLRLTCTEIIANTSVTPALGEFRKLYPDVQIDLVITDRNLDIGAGEADLAVRNGVELPPSNLVARKLASYPFAIYCNRDYASRMGVPASEAEFKNHDIIGGEGAAGVLPGIVWLAEKSGFKPPAIRSSSMTNLLHTVRAGLGLAPLPRLLGDADPSLICCSQDIESALSHSWIVTRRDLKDTPRIRAFIDFIDFIVPFVQRDMKVREARNRSLREAAAANDGEPFDLSKAGSPA